MKNGGYEMTSKINNVVHDIISNDKKDSLKRTPERILEKVAAYYHVTVQELKGAARSERVVLARKVSMYLMRNLITNITLKEIGNVLGGRDHTSVIHGIETINERLRIDNELKYEIYKLQKEIDDTNSGKNRTQCNLKSIRQELKRMLPEEDEGLDIIVLIVLVVLERCEKRKTKEWERVLFELSADQRALSSEELETATDQRKKEIFSLGKYFYIAGKLLRKTVDNDDSKNDDVLEAIRIMWTVW